MVLSFDGRVVATSRRSGSRRDVAPWRFVSGLLRSRHDSEAGGDIDITRSGRFHYGNAFSFFDIEAATTTCLSQEPLPCRVSPKSLPFAGRQA